MIIYAGVRSCYDEGKRTAETLTMDYHRAANLEVRRRVAIHPCGCQLHAFFVQLIDRLARSCVRAGEDRPDLQHVRAAHVHR